LFRTALGEAFRLPTVPPNHDPPDPEGSNALAWIAALVVLLAIGSFAAWQTSPAFRALFVKEPPFVVHNPPNEPKKPDVEPIVEPPISDDEGKTNNDDLPPGETWPPAKTSSVSDLLPSVAKALEFGDREALAELRDSLKKRLEQTWNSSQGREHVPLESLLILDAIRKIDTQLASTSEKTP
jgi:hypothetical protein